MKIENVIWAYNYKLKHNDLDEVYFLFIPNECDFYDYLVYQVLTDCL
jgi:hypothetical protein